MKDRIWSRRQIESEIAAGRKIVIFENKVIKAEAWLPFHPGGEKAILHMVGRDGTDEIKALHSAEARNFMQKFVVGRVEGRWENFIPPIQGGVFRTTNEREGTIESADEEEYNGVILEQSASSSSSGSASPIFEASDGLRKRRSSSVSSTSSICLDTKMQPPKSQTMDEITARNIAADLARYPSLEHSSQDEIVEKYRELDRQLKNAGLYDCPYSAYAWECLRYTTLFILFYTFLQNQYYALSALFLGLFWHQLVFTAHDAGHMGITHNFQIDTGIGIFIADFLGGLSIGWWKRNHNVHHIVTNSPEHDPDIEHMPHFAISHRFFSSLRSTYYDRIMSFDSFAQLSIRYQHYLYYPLLLLGRFNLYILSWSYLLSPTQAPRKGPARLHRPIEILANIVFWYWFGYLTVYRSIPTATSRVLFVLISHMITAPLHVQITLSHFAMSTSDLGAHESFPQKMLRTTMDVDCPPWLDFVHGGLQFQAVHHLFPRVPRHNLRKAQPLVKAFCEDVGIPYTIYGFTEGNGKVIGKLAEVAGQVRIFEECRRHAAQALMRGEDAF